MIARSGYLLLPFPNPEFLFPAPGQHDPPLLFVGPVQDRDVADALHEHRIGAGGQLFDERVAALAVRAGDLPPEQFALPWGPLDPGNAPGTTSFSGRVGRWGSIPEIGDYLIKNNT